MASASFARACVIVLLEGHHHYNDTYHDICHHIGTHI